MQAAHGGFADLSVVHEGARAYVRANHARDDPGRRGEIKMFDRTKALFRRMKKAQPVPCWTEYLRETR